MDAKVSCILQALHSTLSLMSLAPIQSPAPFTSSAFLMTSMEKQQTRRTWLVRTIPNFIFVVLKTPPEQHLGEMLPLGKPLKWPLQLSWSPSLWETNIYTECLHPGEFSFACSLESSCSITFLRFLLQTPSQLLFFPLLQLSWGEESF